MTLHSQDHNNQLCHCERLREFRACFHHQNVSGIQLAQGMNVSTLRTTPDTQFESICFSCFGSRVCFIKYDYKHIPRRNIIIIFFAKMFLFLHMIFTGQPLNSIQRQGLFAYISQLAFFPFTFVITAVWALSYRQIEINLQKVSRDILLLLFSV